MRIRSSDVVITALFAAACLPFLYWIPDDAYISFCYARNWADGHGFSFFPGEHVEGFSNFLWTILLGGFARMGLQVSVTAVALSMLCSLAFVWVSLRLILVIPRQGKSHRHTATPARIALALVATLSMPLLFYATSGMETHAAALLIALGAYHHIRGMQTDRPRHDEISILAFGGVCLLRPEGIAFFAVNTVMILARTGRSSWPGIARSLIVCLIVLVGVLLWRISYFGDWLPNTWYAKPSFDWSYTIPAARGVRYLTRYAGISGLFLLTPAIIAAFVDQRSRGPSCYLAALVGVELAFVVYAGADVLRFDRFMVVIQPLVVAIAAAGALGRGGRPAMVLRGWIIAVTVPILLLNGVRVHRALEKYCEHDWMHARIHNATGTALAHWLPPGSVVVSNEVGALAYASRLPVIDMIGLTDRTVARYVRHAYLTWGTSDHEDCGRQIAEYVLARNPECVIIPSFLPVNVSVGDQAPGTFWAIWQQVFEHPRLHESYRPAFALDLNEHKHLYVFVRTDVETRDDALAELELQRCVSLTRF